MFHDPIHANAPNIGQDIGAQHIAGNERNECLDHTESVHSTQGPRPDELQKPNVYGECFWPEKPLITIDAKAGTYEVSDDGFLACELQVSDSELMPWGHVAWTQGRPHKWYFKEDEPRPVLLGARVLAVSLLTGEPLELAEHPQRWMLKRGDACCILDWQADISELFPDSLDLIGPEPLLKYFRQAWCRSAWADADFSLEARQ